MSALTKELTEDAQRVFDVANVMISEEAFVVGVVLASTNLEEAGTLPVGVCLCDELSNHQKAVLLRSISDRLMEGVTQ